MTDRHTPALAALPALEGGRRETVLEEAARLVDGARGDTYGHPADDFGRTAAMVSGLLREKLREPLTAADVGLIQVCVKLSRLAATPGHRDSLVDVAGYARTVEMVFEREASGD